MGDAMKLTEFPADFWPWFKDKAVTFTDLPAEALPPKLSRWAATHDCPAGECFLNAQSAALACAGVEYYEGIAEHGPVRVHHAWNVVNGQVVDLTYHGRPEEAPIYWGVRLPKRFVRNCRADWGRNCGSLLMAFWSVGDIMMMEE
jgi:hypothetical protein